MMTDRLQKLISEKFFPLLQAQTELRKEDGWIVITTPFLDRHNDRIQLFVCPHLPTIMEGEWFISDDGHSLEDWCELDLSRQSSWMNETLRAHSVDISPDKALFTTATDDTLGKRITALLSVAHVFTNIPLLNTLPATDGVGSW